MPDESAEKPSRVPPRYATWLREEIKGWQREGLIDEFLADALRARYEVPEPQISRLVTILSWFGAILVGVGLILFFAANWEQLPHVFRLVLIFGVILGSYASGYYLRYEPGSSPRVGGALIFLGTLAYGAGIWLTAQMYHLQADYYVGALLWAVGLLPLAYVLESAPLLTLSSALLTLWMAWGTTTTQQGNPWFPVLMVGVVGPLCYRFASRLALVVSLLGLTLYAGFAFFQWTGEQPDWMALLYLLFGTLIYAAGLAHARTERWKDHAETYRSLGLVTILIATYAATFRPIWESGPPWAEVKPLALVITLLVLAGGLGIIQAWGYRPRREGPGTFPAERVGLISLFGIAVVMWLLDVATEPELWATFMALVFNLVFLAEILGTVWVSLLNHRPPFLNLALAFFALGVVTRYFDLCWRLFDRSLFFIGGGLLFLGGGWLLERKRRDWLHEMEGDEHES